MVENAGASKNLWLSPPGKDSGRQGGRKTGIRIADNGILLGDEIEKMLASPVPDEAGGHLHGSMSGESWRAFLKTVRDEAVQRLHSYRLESDEQRGFRASTLAPYHERRLKMERDYLRGLVDLYNSAERAYKTLSG